MARFTSWVAIRRIVKQSPKFKSTIQKTDKWQIIAPLPTMCGGGAAVVDGRIYVAGGRPPHGHDFAVYDPNAGKWTTLVNLPT